jgi:hypothetical protein
LAGTDTEPAKLNFTREAKAWDLMRLKCAVLTKYSREGFGQNDQIAGQ